MSPQHRALATTLLVACLIPSLAQANTITLNDQGIVGSVDGGLTAANEANEELLAEHLLAMAINSTEVVVSPSMNCNAALMPCEYKTGDNPYAAADLTLVGKLDTGSTNVALAHQGNVYIMAKYDGQNAGYVLFYLPDWNADPTRTDNVLPQSAETIFGKQDISHYTAFRATTNVPDGGTTLALLGGALLGLGALRRRFKA